ncbi:MAG: hypothetical protein KAS32_04725, partial [Candidatus Peribacteraceae bacterium]|nr:hypothetical protein [Candidatus Peribacteraceae bacterium]
MKKLDKPKYKARDTFLTCISIVRNRDLKARLNACEDVIVEAETEFDSKVTKGEIYSIRKEEVVNGNVTAKELEKVYTDRMVKKDKPGRHIYDKLISAPTLGICPLCSHRLVETLDHYLPKTDFPRLATTPINLIPSCFDCNKSKSASSPEKPEEETLHPYYDNIEDDEWLVAKVNKSTPPTLTYFVKPANDWSELLGERVKYHFTALSLNKLYSTQAAVQLTSIY